MKVNSTIDNPAVVDLTPNSKSALLDQGTNCRLVKQGSEVGAGVGPSASGLCLAAQGERNKPEISVPGDLGRLVKYRT